MIFFKSSIKVNIKSRKTALKPAQESRVNGFGNSRRLVRQFDYLKSKNKFGTKLKNNFLKKFKDHIEPSRGHWSYDGFGYRPYLAGVQFRRTSLATFQHGGSHGQAVALVSGSWATLAQEQFSQPNAASPSSFLRHLSLSGAHIVGNSKNISHGGRRFAITSEVRSSGDSRQSKAC